MKETYRDKGAWSKAGRGLARAGGIYPLKVHTKTRLAFTQAGAAGHHAVDDEVPTTMITFDADTVVDVDKLTVGNIDGVDEMLVHLVCDKYESTLRLKTALDLFGDDEIDRMLDYCVSHLEEQSDGNGYPEYGIWG
jgi:hypothetical protein